MKKPLRCRLGWHKWDFSKIEYPPESRFCLDCPKRQKQVRSRDDGWEWVDVEEKHDP